MFYVIYLARHNTISISFNYCAGSRLRYPIVTPMTLTQFNYIVALADTLHFGRAAEHCCVSQSALSMALKDLESELGLMLFERDRKGVRPTPAGQKVIEKARLALRHSGDIKLLAQQAQAPLAQPLQIGVCQTYAPYYLPRLATQLQHRYPGSQATLAEAPAEQLIQRLLAGQLDAVVASWQRVAGTRAQPLAEEPLVAIVRQQDPLAHVASVSLAQLADAHLWLPLGSFKRDITERCPALLTAARAVHELDIGIHTLLQHISVAGGLSIVPQSLAHSARLAADGLVARAFDGHFTRKVSLLWRTSSVRPQDMESLALEVTNLCCNAHWSPSYQAPEALLIDNSYW